MIVTCASCLTKYQLDDSRISEKGAKVRCSRCKHVFYVVMPPETKEEVAENFESFAKFHEDLIGKDQRGIEPPSLEDEEEKEARKKEEAPVGAEEEEEKFLFSDQSSQEQVESFSLPELEEEKEAGIKEAKPKRVPLDERRMRGERKKTRLFALVVVIAILVFGLFYLWTEMESGGKLSSYLESPLKKVTQLWEKLWGTEREGLVVKDLTGYEEKMGELSFFVIEGKVDNQSQKTKKHIKVKVVIFDQNRMKVAEKETLCGRTIGRGELKNLPSDFFSGEMIIQPKAKNEMLAPSGKTIPFVVVFKDLPAQAKEFKVEIVEAPSL